MSGRSRESLIICRDEGLVEQVLAAAAAVRSPMRRVRESGDLRQAWKGAPSIFVGADQAAWLVGLGLPTRRGVHVVGRSADEVMAWSVPLEAAVLVLPDQAGFISAILDSGAADAGGTLLRVLGGSGGLGASTLAAGLAQVAARQWPSALVELADCGGGIDVMLGAEQVPGWRWDDLSGASGHLGEVTDRLPHQAGLPMVALGPSGRMPGPQAAAAVLRTVLRSHRVVVVDAGRGEQSSGEHWSQSRSLLLVGADVRSVLAARALVAERGWRDVELVVRTGPGRSLSPDDVAQALGFGVVGRVGHHPRLPRDLAHGVPPALGARSRFARECRTILAAVMDT
ncbi:septum site-determining protein Ssd [Propionibacteriaceae bacterium Y1923]|uniref:septum site-determining protein Ssd n=1 Tax=Aestuariimicrobium sp. Y1814 TaxID=3418742 RepID=UPI003C17745A